MPMNSHFRSMAADFDHPLEMLAACHDRIEDRCDLLLRLIDHAAKHGCDAQAMQAAANVIRYFDTAGEHHHEDEERDLFPRLIAADATRSMALVEALVEEHGAMRKAWRGLHAALEMIARGEPAMLEAARVRSFSELYRAHIAREEAELLPLARALLSVDELEAIGRSMARRRGVSA